MKILITNTVALNVGDAAILQGMIDILHAAFGKDIELVIYDNNGEIPGQYYPNLTFRDSLYNRVYKHVRLLGRLLLTRRILYYINTITFYAGAWCIRQQLLFIARLFLKPVVFSELVEYSQADLIVSTGGTYLVENYSLTPRIFDYEISLYFKRPLIFFTQSLGPFSTPSNRKALKQIFENSALILLRDQKSLDNLHNLGIKNRNVHIVADAAFALADLTNIDAKSTTTYSCSSLRVAISVRKWNYFKTVNSTVGMKKYTDALRSLTIYLVNKYDANVTYISTCQGIPEYTDDSKTALEVFEKLPDNIRESVVINKDFHSPKQLLEILNEFDLVVATRMHMAILALGVGTPVLPIAYEFKMKELFEKLGQGCWVQDIENISASSLIKTIDLFLGSLSQIHNSLQNAVKKEIEDALNSCNLVISSLK